MKPGPVAISAFSELEMRALQPHPSAGTAIRSQCGCRRRIPCGAFLTGDFGIGGVRVGLMAGLSCCSGSIDVIWLQAAHL
jgi:hypothetical protein